MLPKPLRLRPFRPFSVLDLFLVDALSLDVSFVLPRDVSIVFQVGKIQRRLGQVDEAVDSFNEALAQDPTSLLALEGAGEAYLAQAHARTSEGLYTAALGALVKGCDATERFLDLTGDLLEASPRSISSKHLLEASPRSISRT